VCQTAIGTTGVEGGAHKRRLYDSSACGLDGLQQQEYPEYREYREYPEYRECRAPYDLQQLSESPSSACVENVHVNQHQQQYLQQQQQQIRQYNHNHHDHHLQKRTRYHTGHGIACSSAPSQDERTQLQSQKASQPSRNSYVSETLFKALKALFPSMSDETIANVLRECGEDIDGAIRRLNELQLGAGSEELHGGEEQLRDGQTRASAQEEGVARDRCVSGEWVDALVGQMSQASDVEDAKRRAEGVLHGVLAEEGRKAREHVDCLQKENALLKRAVGIQNSKIHELTEKCKGVEELAGKLQEVKARCQALEMHNYSLQVHLKQATSSSLGGPHGHSGLDKDGGNNPDVY